MISIPDIEAFIGIDREAIKLILSAVGVVTASITACSLVVASFTYFGNRRSRDFTAVLSIQKMVREESNLLYASSKPLDLDKYTWFASQYFDALEVAAFSVNKRLLDSKSRKFEAEWLDRETLKLFHHEGVLGALFHRARERGAYKELDAFFKRRHPRYIAPERSTSSIGENSGSLTTRNSS